MRVGNTVAAMPDPATFTTTLNNTMATCGVDIVIATQHYTYQQYKENAYTNGDVTVSNDQIYDVAGRNPYEAKTLFAAAALTQDVKGNTFSFQLPSNLMFSHNQASPIQIQMDFDNGSGFQTITPDSPVSITYQNGGIKTIKVKYSYSNGSTMSSHSRIVVDYVNPIDPKSFDGSGRSLFTITGAPWQGQSATGRVTVELAAGHTQLTKPLIVVEGFDPDNDFDYFDLIFDNGPQGLRIDLDPDPAIFYTLNQAIEDEDYDLVFVDFTNSTDFIQRNGLMVEEVIRQVNQQKVGNEKNVVLGISMGGLVARYALRDMEINSETHETKLYISHDSPHQGANVPLSIQALVRNLVGEEVALPVLFGLVDIPIIDVVDEFEELQDALALLESPAAQQMLIYQITGTGSSINHPSGNTLHDDFLNEYKTMGYPQQDNIRNIAITNSTDCGTPLDFAPYDILLDFDESIDDISDFEFFLQGLVDVIGINPLRGLTSILSTKRDIKAQFKCNALPSLQLKRIYSGRIFIQKKLFGFINVNEDLMDKGLFHSGNDMLPLDSANGGIFDIETFATIPTEFASSVLQSRFSFIPVYSSLDIGQGNVNITPSDLLKKYDATIPPSAPKDIPFDNFHANPLISQAHTQFTLSNGNWLISELSGTPEITTCTFACNISNAEIQGPDEFCTTATYSLPSGAIDYNWLFSGGSLSIPDPLQPNVVQVQGFIDGYHTLKATINEPDCDFNQTFTKTIYFGKPTAGGNLIEINADTTPVLTIYPDDGSYCDIVAYQIINWPDFEVVNNIEMRKISGNSYWDGDIRSGRDLRVAFFPDCNETFEFEVRVENECGWSDWQEFSVDLQVCDTTCGTPTPPINGIQSENFIISPVPASTVIAIDMKQDPQWEFFSLDCIDGISDIGGNTFCTYYVDVKLFDFQGNQVLNISGHQLGSSFDVSHLQTGTYFLQLQHGSFQMETHQIRIN